MTEKNWLDPDFLEKYDFVVKPGTPDYEERVCELTPEQYLQQAKAFRSLEWDRYGTTGELGPDYFEMADDDIRQMEEELHQGEFNKEFDTLSDADVLFTARSWLVNLTANNNEDARKMGITDEQIADLRAKVAAMEKAVEAEKKEIYRKQKARVQRASENLLTKLGLTSTPVVLIQPKKPDDSNAN